MVKNWSEIMWMELEEETKGEVIRACIREWSARIREQYGCEGSKGRSVNSELAIK